MVGGLCIVGVDFDGWMCVCVFCWCGLWGSGVLCVVIFGGIEFCDVMCVGWRGYLVIGVGCVWEGVVGGDVGFGAGLLIKLFL